MILYIGQITTISFDIRVSSFLIRCDVVGFTWLKFFIILHLYHSLKDIK